jgi:hypothetical protein
MEERENRKRKNKKRISTKKREEKRKPAAQLGPCPEPNPAQIRSQSAARLS